MSKVDELHQAVKRGDTARMRKLLDENRDLANSPSETDARGTSPLHVAAEFGQADAARMLLAYGADVALRDAENDGGALRAEALERDVDAVLTRSFVWRPAFPRQDLRR